MRGNQLAFKELRRLVKFLLDCSRPKVRDLNNNCLLAAGLGKPAPSQSLVKKGIRQNQLVGQGEGILVDDDL